MGIRRKKIVYRTAILVALVFLFNAVAQQVFAQASLTESYLNNIQKGSQSLRIETCKRLYNYSGVTDGRIFDLLESNILELTKKSKLAKIEKTEVVWSIKALASSGKANYAPTLRKLAQDKSIRRKFRREAEAALLEASKFARWNPVINSKAHELSSRRGSLALWMRLLDSDDAEMSLHAVENAHKYAVYDTDFLILLEDKLKSLYPSKTRSKASLRLQGKAMHYLMSHPEFGKYTSIVNEVAEQSPNRYVKKSARKDLRQ